MTAQRSRWLATTAAAAAILAACSSGGSTTTATTPTTTTVTTTTGGSSSTVFEQGKIDEGLRPYITLAVADLAGHLGVDAASITPLSAVVVVWPDGSLGCPKPGMSYTQALVDGALIELGAGGAVYRYHSGGSTKPFLCDQPLLQPPPTGDG